MSTSSTYRYAKYAYQQFDQECKDLKFQLWMQGFTNIQQIVWQYRSPCLSPAVKYVLHHCNENNRAWLSYAHCVYFGNVRREPSLEPLILSDDCQAIYYALGIIHGPWPELEERLTDGFTILSYNKLLRNNAPWPDKEQYLATCPKSAYWYASGVLYGSFPAGEDVIAHSGLHSRLYILHVLRGDFQRYVDLWHDDKKKMNNYLRWLREAQAVKTPQGN